MRTAEQAVAYCMEDRGMLDFTTEAIAVFLTFEQAKPMLKPEAKPEDWGESTPLTQENVIAEMRKTPRYPEEEITAKAAQALVARAVLDNKEIRITNGGDMLVFHFAHGRQIHPVTGADFWSRVFA